ncbi:hypothetical protein FBZ96_11578 [Bradyrhizobium stylosanthis]|uniref:Uncharacterized protein n=1 Tax=Bradyrhizobium stylosanthis TaxID=1803665 RepID=A0A560CZX4_9BRAD|nr:hypothetical protein FBZ96_11578 [Bradyrhizobium stylosanthis]
MTAKAKGNILEDLVTLACPSPELRTNEKWTYLVRFLVRSSC